MLLSVFRSYGSTRTVLRNFRFNSYLSPARGVITKKRNVLFSKMPSDFEEKTTERIKNLKIASEGYKLIYCSKDLTAMFVARATMVFFFVVGTWMAVQIYLKPDFIILEGFMKVEEIILLLYVHVAVAYVFATRNVYYIFRKGNSYKTVCYGLFGKYQPRIIDHQGTDIQPSPTLPSFYNIKGKSVIFTPSGFINDIEYVALRKQYLPKK